MNRVSLPQTYPWSLHGLIEVWFPKLPTFSQSISDPFLKKKRDPVRAEMLRGTGTLIGRKYLITAAHNFYSAEYGDAISESGMVYFGVNTEEYRKAKKENKFSYYLGSEIEKVHIYTNYRELVDANDPEQFNYDIAVVKLKKDFEEDLEGWASVQEVLGKDLSEGENLNVTGYPAPISEDNINSHCMFTSEGPLKKMKEWRLHYHMETRKGHSGAGVWRFDEAQIQVGDDKTVQCVGVHTRGPEKNPSAEEVYSSGVLINKKHFDSITKWLKL